MILANNKKAYFDYFIEDKIEAGIELVGSEVKSIKAGKVSIKEGISNRKVFVETEELVECMWDVTNSPHYYEFDEKNYAMIDTDSGEIFNLGDKLDVIVVRADMSDLEVEVAPYNEEYFSERRNRRGER